MNPIGENHLEIDQIIGNIESKQCFSLKQKIDFQETVSKLDKHPNCDALKGRLQAIIAEEKGNMSGKVLGSSLSGKISAVISQMRWGISSSRKEIAEKMLIETTLKEFDCSLDTPGVKLHENPDPVLQIQIPDIDPNSGRIRSMQDAFIDIGSGVMLINKNSQNISSKDMLRALSVSTKNFKEGDAKWAEVDYNPNTGNTTVLAQNFSQDVKTGYITRNPDPDKLKGADMDALHDFIMENKDNYVKEAKSKRESVYLSTKKTGLARSIHFTPEGKVFVHLNKKTLRPHMTDPNRQVGGDTLLGKGSFKTVTIAVDLETGKRFASASMTEEEAKSEIASLKPFKGMAGFPQIGSVMRYTSLKTGKVKVRILYEIADRGDLKGLIKDKKLAREEKPIVAKKLIKALSIIHKKKMLHRDIKGANILVSGKGANIQPKIADFGLSISNTDSQEKQKGSGTVLYFSPEFARACRSGDLKEVEKATTEAHDIWALGVVLDELIHDGVRVYAPIVPPYANKDQAMDIIRHHPPPAEPGDKASIEHLIWSMLRISPGDRVTMGQLLSHPSLRNV